MADVFVEVPSPLRECLLHCEIHCVRECCGIDAISTDRELIAAWCRHAGPAAVSETKWQLSELVRVVEDRSKKVSSPFLNHYTCDEAARRELLEFLAAFCAGLASIAEQVAPADKPAAK
jgi:hypothetical protein